MYLYAIYAVSRTNLPLIKNKPTTSPILVRKAKAPFPNNGLELVCIWSTPCQQLFHNCTTTVPQLLHVLSTTGPQFVYNWSTTGLQPVYT